MVLYRENIPGAANSTAGQRRTSTAAAASSSRTNTAPAFMSLAEKYGMADMQIGETSDVEQQTVEQEFQSYITAALSSSATNLVKFWEVCGFGMIWLTLLA